MTTLINFRAAHQIVTAKNFEADDTRPVDLEFYPNAKLHAYPVEFDGDRVTYYIIEMTDGFHYTFMHPADDIAPTLADAEVALHDFIAECSQ